MEFFIPHLIGQPEAAEAEWQRYLQVSPAPADSKRAYSVTYWHDGSKYVATVGEVRIGYSPQTGPRGGRIKNAPLQRIGFRSGTVISGIVDAGHVLYLWSYTPSAPWHNPAMVGPQSVEQIEYFE